jgi:hypothetical protein
MGDMPCRWCGESTFLRFRFDMAGFGDQWVRYHKAFGQTDEPWPLCVVHREGRYGIDWDAGEAATHGCEEYELSHQCACGHSSSYHNVRVATDHAAAAASPRGVYLCRPCAGLVAVSTRRRLRPLDRDNYAREAPTLSLEEVDELFEDPLNGLTQSEVAQAARQFFRKFEGASV